MFNIFNARQYPGDHWPTREKVRGAPVCHCLHFALKPPLFFRV